MSTMTFNVADITNRTVNTRFGPKLTWTLISDSGEKYAFPFADPARSGIRVGSVVTGMVKTDPKYGFQIDPKTVTVGGTAPPPAEGTPTTTTAPRTSYGGRGDRVFPVPSQHGDMAIIRQNALTNAVSTVADWVATQPTEKWPSLDDWTELVINTAYKFADFSSGQREAKAARKMAKIGMEASDIHTAIAAHIPKEEDDNG